MRMLTYRHDGEKGKITMLNVKNQTNKAKTYEVLGGYLMNNNEINAEYLAREIVLCVLDNTESWYREMRENTRRKARNVAICAMLEYIRERLNDWNPGCGYYATTKQCIQFDREHGGSLEKVLDIVEAHIREEREEARAER